MAGLYSRQKDWNDGDILTEADLEAEFDHIYNSVVAGTTSTVGCVQLEDSVTSTSVTKAATPKSVKEAYDHAGAGGGGGLEWSLISTNTSAVAAHGYLINASAAAITLTLPISPSVGDTVGVCDAYNKATTNTITINRNAQNIEGSAENLVVDIDGAGFTLVFAGATRGWEIVTEMAGVSGGGLSNIVEDTTPQLGGNLDMNGKSIGGNTEAQIDDAVSKKHSANGDTALGTQTEALEMGGFSINDINVVNIKASSCKVHNNTGTTLSAGICVYPTGVVGSVVAVAKCDSTDKDKMPCLGIISADIANGAEGKAVTCGIKSMNTSGFTGAVGDRVYVQSDGTIDTVEPATGSVQRVGMLVVKDANGKIYAHSRGRKSIYAAADEHPIIRMGSTGHLKASFHKYDNTEVASIDADGNLTLNGTVDGRDVDADGTKLDTIETSADITDAVNIASTTHGTGAKTTPVNADELGLIDSAASWVLKKLTWANLKATLKTYFDTLYDDCKASKTTGAWSKSIGSGGDYATWAAMVAAMPDMIAHAVTVTIKAGTTLTEICNLKNKHGLTADAAITIQAEKYFPTSGAIPTADSATTTTLVDGALATAAKGNDYFNSCWIFICAAGTHNISAVTVGGAGSGEFKVAGDETARYIAGDTLIVKGSTNNDGEYTVSAGGSSHAGGTTTIPVDEAVAAVADGTIQSQGVLDNGFVAITDYIDASGTVTVASWPAAQPIAGDRYIIVGALVDCEGTRDQGMYCRNNTLPVYINGIGVTNANLYGFQIYACSWIQMQYNATDKADLTGFYTQNCIRGSFKYCGIVDNNTDSSCSFGGIRLESMLFAEVRGCGISDNDDFGIIVARGGYARIKDNFGDNNGVWGTYAMQSGQAECSGTECSGSSGNHSNGVGDGSLAY